MKVYILDRKTTEVAHTYKSVKEFESDVSAMLDLLGDGEDEFMPQGFFKCSESYHKYNSGYLCVPNKKGFIDYAKDRLRANNAT